MYVNDTARPTFSVGRFCLMTMTALITHIRKTLGDVQTPVSVYHHVRERYPESVLLESTDYHAAEDSTSIVAFGTLARFEAQTDGTCRLDTALDLSAPATDAPLRQALQHLVNTTAFDQPDAALPFNGWYGLTGFEAAGAFDQVRSEAPDAPDSLPVMRYLLFRYLVVFDHFRSKLLLIENVPSGESPTPEVFDLLLRDRSFVQNPFSLEGESKASCTPESFLDMVQSAKEHCQRGDVFQLVVSRRFRQGFRGDDLAVYRCLRSVNPSPYLFYFDFGDFRIFGSSPEAQLVVEGGKAQIHPIAGTFPRTGNDAADFEAAGRLADDIKENAEHVMLVDLARNDLSRHCREVEVQTFKEVQFFSHVIHLVSVVEGTLREGTSALEVFADTFPAGTLSGAPKLRALELIRDLEPQSRSFYGGAIGLFTPGGRVNHAITIRSFLSAGGVLHSQAGAGIVIGSDPQKELEEVNHKLGALRRALELAQTL